MSNDVTDDNFKLNSTFFFEYQISFSLPILFLIKNKLEKNYLIITVSSLDVSSELSKIWSRSL